MTTRFIEQAIARAGLLPLLDARRSGRLDALGDFAAALSAADLLVIGAVADVVRAEEIGGEVRIHPGQGTKPDPNVAWITVDDELALLRAIALARVTSVPGARIGVDWGRCGLELAQVALGFGASDLMGPIARKSGLAILDSEARKVKGQGMVALAAIKRREIEALVRNAARVAVFTDEAQPSPRAEDAHV